MKAAVAGLLLVTTACMPSHQLGDPKPQHLAKAPVETHISVPDSIGDAPPRIDINQLDVDNGHDRLLIGIHVQHLQPKTTGRLRVQIDVGKPLGWGYFINIDRPDRPAQLAWTRMYSENGGGGSIRCPDLGVTWTTSWVSLNIPRHCMNRPNDARVRVEASLDTPRALVADTVPDPPYLFTRWVDQG